MSSSSNAPTGGGPVPMELASAISLLEKKRPTETEPVTKPK